MPVKPKDFKILAIRPRKDCHTKYRNNLISNQLYQFYKEYTFLLNNDGEPAKIRYDAKEVGIFNRYIHEDNYLHINVSAIVGKNGSGKSTLTELLFFSSYLISLKNYLLNEKQADFDLIKRQFKVEIYYAVNNKFFCLVFDEGFFSPVLPVRSNIKYIDFWSVEEGTFNLGDFFYTIAGNYSLYGLNEALIGSWIGELFHKNDGYQTPIVINPFRNKGTINISGELHFSQTRLLSNLMLNRKNQIEILPGKQVKELYFIIDRQKISKINGFALNRVSKELFNNSNETKKSIFDLAYKTLVGTPLDENSMADAEWRKLTSDYVFGKLIRIAMNYGEYKKYYQTLGNDGVPTLINVNEYLNELKDDKTHITLKLRQALMFYKFDTLRLNEKEGVRKIGRNIFIPITVFNNRVKKLMGEHPEIDPMEFIPIAPFTPRLEIHNDAPFHKLSSGEQQYINCLQAIVYHLTNLNSVYNSKVENKITYDCVNVIQDEIELYFHPDFQRRFIKDLLETVGNLKLPNIRGINFQFLTHSPFILSDIPSKNVLRLNNGNVYEDDAPTFAGNIHEMLTSAFFMNDTIGDFARDQCQDILRFYEKVLNSNSQNEFAKEYKSLREKFQFILSQIGESVIKGILENHLAYLDETLLENSKSKALLREEYKKMIELYNKKIDKLDAEN